MLSGDTLLSSKLHLSACLFLVGSAAQWAGSSPVPTREESEQIPERSHAAAMLSGISDFSPPHVPTSRTLRAVDLRVTLGHDAAF